MPHETPLIATLVAGLGLAFVFGAIANRLRLPPLVGYLLAGIFVGPYTPGFVADQSLAPELAEIGVILLMFGVGLHFSMKDLNSVRAIAIPGAIAQIAFATLLGACLGLLLGWDFGASAVFGLALSVASTVVLLRALQERRLIETERGRIAVGWLIVEDLAMVLALVLLPAFAGASALETSGSAVDEAVETVVTSPGLGLVLGLTFLKVAVFIGLMLIVGRRVVPWMLHYVAHTGSRELFRLAVLAIALGVAFGAAKLFGVSLALGAFFAGMIMSESALSQRAAEESLPLRDAFAVLFFVSVGMLFDPSNLWTEALPILATLFIIVIGKSVAAFIIVLAFRHPVSTALTISASLAQIGEFSFILAGLGVGLGVLPERAQDLILAGAILSMLFNPLVFFLIERFGDRIDAQVARFLPQLAKPVPEAATKDKIPAKTLLADHSVLIGYGRVGSIVGEALQEASYPFLVIEDSDTIIRQLHGTGAETIAGNAAKPEILDAANVAGARRLVIAIPNAFEAARIITQARAANPGIEIIARAHSDAEVGHLVGLGANSVIMGEREIGRAMIELVLGPSAPIDMTAAPGPG